MPKKFKFSFNGRKLGALGTFSDHTETYEANEMGEALFMLHTDYEHIRILIAYRGKVKLPVPGAIQNVELINNGYKGKQSSKK